MIKALIFDCFGVLYWDDLKRLYALVHADQFQELNDIMHACDHGYIGRQDFLDQVAELAGISVDAVKAVLHEKQHRNEPLIARAKQLKSDYKIGLLSNMGYDSLSDLFTESERNELFDDMVISSDVGLIKPSWDIFELTLERLGVAAADTIFIDDQPANIDGAQRIGMNTILFTTNHQFEAELARITQADNARVT